MIRLDGRNPSEIRPIRIYRQFTRYSAGSVLIECGFTKVLVTATIEDKVPPFLRDSGSGWVTAEYAMLPSATHSRSSREVSKGRPSGRTCEIQRLIGRALRACLNMELLGERSIIIDADVLQADGGTRTAAINAGMVALQDAIHSLMAAGRLSTNPLIATIGAISAGIVDDVPMVDLCYEEDSNAMVDMNIVMTSTGQIIEIQGTGERRGFLPIELEKLMGISTTAIHSIIETYHRNPN